MTPAPSPSECDHLRAPNPYTVLLASWILVGILISYLPQHLKIITHRSSAGLSPYWVLLGGLSCIAAIGNILVLPKSRRDVGCCKVVSGGECAAALLGVGQIGLQWGCFMFIVLLFLIFFPADKTTTSSDDAPTKTQPYTRRTAISVGVIILASLLVVGLTSMTMVVAFPSKTQAWANFLGTVAGSLAMIQWIPQIWATFQLKDIGSLSIVTMLMQVPGSFLFAFSLWLRVGWVGWATWLVYIVTGTLQGILLGLAITYWFAGRASADDELLDGGSSLDEEEIAAEEQGATETTALLGNGHTGTPSKVRPVAATKDSTGSQNRQSSMLYAATPPEHDSGSGSGKGT